MEGCVENDGCGMVVRKGERLRRVESDGTLNGKAHFWHALLLLPIR